jgi:hypothetical protein
MQSYFFLKLLFTLVYIIIICICKVYPTSKIIQLSVKLSIQLRPEVIIAFMKFTKICAFKHLINEKEFIN